MSNNDYSTKGTTAERALGTVLGDKPPEAQVSPEEVLARILAAPSPGGPQPTSYSAATDALAKAFLVLVEEGHTDLLMADNWTVWEAITLRWAGFDDWLGGATGFMVGFGFNQVRWIKASELQPNPAIFTVSVKE